MLTSYQAALADIDGMIGIALLLAVALAVAYRPAVGILARLHIPPGLALAGVALAAALLGSSTRPLSYDEAFTAAITALPPDRIVLATAGDVHPPAYYLAVRAARVVFGDSESALRLWSAVCAAVAAVLVYRIGRRYLTPSRALTAGYVAALLPGLLTYAQTARMYSMLAALCLAAFWAALNGRWLLFVGAAGLAVYTHNYAWLYIIALAPLWWWDERGCLALAAVVILYLPWLSGGLGQQLAHVAAGFWIQPLTVWRLFEPALMIGTGYSAPPLMTVGLLGLFLLLSGAGLWAIVTMFPGVFSDFHTEITLRSPMRWARDRVALLSFLIVPVALAAVASILFRPVYLPRAFIPGVYLLPVCWLAWLASRPPWVRRAAGAALVAAVLFHYIPASTGLDVRGLIKKADIQPGDQLYHVEIASLINLEYYTPDSDHWLYPYASDLSQTLSSQTQAVMGLRAAEYVALPAPAGRRLLVICETPFTTPAQEAEIARLLDRPGLVQLARQGDSLRTFTIYEVET
jgi:hypothetical protein